MSASNPRPSAELAAYPPFDRLEAESLAFLDQHLQPVRFGSGAVLVAPDQGPVAAMYVILRGRVRESAFNGAHAGGDADLMLSVGECFPIGALTGRRASGHLFVASTEVDAYQLPAGSFHQLLDLSPAFSRFCSSHLANLVSRSRLELQAQLVQQASVQQTLGRPLRELVKQAPISVAGDATIQAAVEIMGQRKIGSVIVVDGEGRPQGLLTQSDVVRRVVLGQVPLDRPIAEVMSRDPATLPMGASAYDAMFAMASRGIRHLLLVDGDGRLAGVISERDLFALQRVGLGQVRRAIEAAEDVAGIRNALRDVQQAAFNMLAQGVGAEQLTQFISALNDAATVRVIELNLARHPVEDIEWTWLAFGSEGREEQTLATDQDNGIVFLPSPAADVEECRQRLLALARDVNRDLDQCGFSLCKGNIMAGNPEWCLTLQGWKDRFSTWINSPQPEALLNATIFFDFRPLFGRRQLAGRMHEHLFALSSRDQAFQKMLAANALTGSVPLGLIRDFVTESDDHGKGYIDLKKSGARLFVDAARVFALAHGVEAASTIGRLRRTARLPGGVGDEVESMVEAFNIIQMLRLRHQYLESGQGRAGDNRVFVDRLSDLDRRILKEALRQAKKLQQRLRLNYQL